MMLFVLVALLGVDGNVLEVRHTEIAPRIDGYIEAVWQTADSAYEFTQYRPNEGKPAAEPTVVYVLADEDNIYFAFRCLTPGRKPVASFVGAEDHVYLYLDTFNNKTSAYWFTVWASGRHYDGLMLENGKVWDSSWDGVWYYGVRCFDEWYEVEIKLPFKSIRYNKDIFEWGVNFMFWSVKNYEVSYWAPVTQKDGNQVSKFGSLTGLEPSSKGYYLELYPEGFCRYDKVNEEEKYELRGSLNFKWDFTPQATINATVYPDFAQIESDPYRLNLSRYPIRFSERRPFFIEGSDVFRMTSLGQGYFLPLEIFYSRRIGRPQADGGSVPIMGGLKFINKGKRWNLGMLSVLADETDDGPHQGFGIISTRYSILENSEIGLLISSAATSRNDYNYAVGLDGAYRYGSSQFILQSALSDRNTKKGWAVSTGGLYSAPNFKIMTSFLAVNDSFDIWDVGYVPWSGLTKFYLSAGPQWFYKSGTIAALFMGPGITLTKEPDSDDWSKILSIRLEPQFMPFWGTSMRFDIGNKFEADTDYLFYKTSISISSGLRTKYQLRLGSSYAHRYNYNQDWLANQFDTWFLFEYYGMSPLSMSSTVDFVVEWDPDGNIAAITPYATPRIGYRFTADMGIALYSEFVMRTTEGNLRNTEVYSNRIGLLFSWNYKPKSWLYVALNDYRERDELNRLRPQYRIGAIKVKYLIYF